MRFRAITLSSLLVLSFIWTNSAFGQTTEDEIASMRGEIAAMRMTMERILAGRRAVDRLLADAIILTDQDCAVLGADWRRYEGMSGRFPLAAGATQDARREERTFTIGDRGGAYLHPLSRDEMARHEHQIIEYEANNRTRRGMRLFIADNVDWVTHHGQAESVMTVYRNPDQYNTDRRLLAKADGPARSRPHNNMPPYLVLNFCHKGGSRD